MGSEFREQLKGAYHDYEKEYGQDTPVLYQAINPLSVGSVVVGLLSALAFFHWGFLFLPLVGVLLGIAGLVNLVRAEGGKSGDLSVVYRNRFVASARRWFVCPVGLPVLPHDAAGLPLNQLRFARIDGSQQAFPRSCLRTGRPSRFYPGLHVPCKTADRIENLRHVARQRSVSVLSTESEDYRSGVC